MENTWKKDEKGVLLLPNKELGEKAVYNGSAFQKENELGPWPFVYRVDLTKEEREKYGVNSYIMRTFLSDPKTVSNQRYALIDPLNGVMSFETEGMEDPKITFDNEGNEYVIYVGWDGISARTGLIKNGNKLGVIGPNIPLEEAIKLIENNKYEKLFKPIWEDQLKGHVEKFGEENSSTIYLWNKDASLHQIDGEWIYYFRIDPHMHVAKASSIEELMDATYWKNVISNLDKHTFMENEESWACKKIGLGAPIMKIGDMFVGIYHGVDEDLNYFGSFFSTDVRDPTKVVSKLKDPLFKPDSEKYEFIDNEGVKKMVNFPTGMIQTGDVLSVISGVADREMEYRTTNINWLIEALNKERLN